MVVRHHHSVFYIVDAVFKIDLHLWGLSVVECGFRETRFGFILGRSN